MHAQESMRNWHKCILGYGWFFEYFPMDIVTCLGTFGKQAGRIGNPCISEFFEEWARILSIVWWQIAWYKESTAYASYKFRTITINKIDSLLRVFEGELIEIWKYVLVGACLLSFIVDKSMLNRNKDQGDTAGMVEFSYILHADKGTIIQLCIYNAWYRRGVKNTSS